MSTTSCSERLCLFCFFLNSSCVDSRFLVFSFRSFSDLAFVSFAFTINCPLPLLPFFVAACRLQASTPIAIDLLAFELRTHPNRSFVDYLLSGLRVGFHTGIQELPLLSQHGVNLRSARNFPSVVSQLLREEVASGFLLGPFDVAPFPVFRISPLGLVFGKYSGKPRLILDLSWPHDHPIVASINALIDKDECSMVYATIDQAIQRILDTGRGAYLCKCDITSAFKLLPIHPTLIPFYGCFWDGRFYFFQRLPFGGRSSPRIFDCLSQALEWILRSNYHLAYCQHLLDDFLTIDATETAGLRTMAVLSMVFNRLQIPLSSSKTTGPVRSLEYLGIVLDTQVFESRIPADKISRMQVLLRHFSARKRCTKRELLQLIGHFNFATRVIVQGRSFLSYLFQLSCSVDALHLHVRLGKEARLDLSMWDHFLSEWNGHSLFLVSSLITNVDLRLFTDAAGGLGYGGIFGSRWFSAIWTSTFRQLPGFTRNSTLIELVPIVVAACVWGRYWSRQRIILHCDNQALVYGLNKRRSSDPTTMLFLRRLTLLSMQFNFHILAVHIAGAANGIADALSRQQWARFRSLAPWAEPTSCPVPALSDLTYPSIFPLPTAPIVD